MPDLVDVVTEDRRWNELGIAALAETACCAALHEIGLAPANFAIALLAADDRRITGLNRQFRGKSAPTNVLSWPAFELGPAVPGDAPRLPPPEARELGDLAMAFETCMAEAGAQKKATADHLSHLLVHGCLHLLGYDHVLEKDAVRMETLEGTILAKLGVANPY